jgi:formate/nitrite transporter FocA (FNT family)
VTTAPSPEEIYERAEREGRRRLELSLLDQVATGFIAGVTIIFGIVALGTVAALAEPTLGREVAKILGALAFGIGVVFLVVGRSELFTENFFDPVTAVVHADRSRAAWLRLLRLWASTFVLNLVGGAVLVAVLTVDGALPAESNHTLERIAEEIAAKSWTATLARAVLAGALITLLSYMLKAVDTASARIAVAYMVGAFLALGPFDHVLARRRRRVRRPRREPAGVGARQPRRRPAPHHADAHRPGQERVTRLRCWPTRCSRPSTCATATSQ